jgi:hypothetical protein
LESVQAVELAKEKEEGIVSKIVGILLANSEVPKFEFPTCPLGRQKS